MSFSPAYCSTPATPGNPFACWGLTPTREADVPEGGRVCRHMTLTCVGGTVVACSGTNNGHAVGKGPLGRCNACQGKGYQTPEDVRRTDYYWNHRPLSDWG